MELKDGVVTVITVEVGRGGKCIRSYDSRERPSELSVSIFCQLSGGKVHK